MAAEPPLLLPGYTAVPPRLPGEPDRGPAGGAMLWLRLLRGGIGLAVAAVLLSPAWLVYGLLAVVFGRPPNVPTVAEVALYLRAAWTERPPPPGLPFAHRLRLTQLVLRTVVLAPVVGSAWLLDELFEGRALRRFALRAPLFEVSAGRSGSTQLARYLEDDAAFSAPSILQAMFPYLWLWRLLRGLGAGRLDRARVAAKVEGALPPEFVERHEGDPFRTDTFEAALFVGRLQALSLHFGPRFALEQFSTSALHAGNRALWEEDFVAIVEGVSRRHLCWQGVSPGGTEPRIFLKGHFLCAAPALARRFPDATFVTMLRDPVARFQSAINYLRVNPADPVLGPPPWPWLTELVVKGEVRYCDLEQRWFEEPGPPLRHVIRFEDYREDLGGTLDALYRACLGGAPPPGLPREHAPRRRHAYTVDRSLAELGVDVPALEARLAAWRAWCAGRGGPRRAGAEG